jgi:hypothetical protein
MERQMAETTEQLIARVQALPKTHRVVTVWANGCETRQETHSAAAAENYAVRMRRAIKSGEAVSVTVSTK